MAERILTFSGTGTLKTWTEPEQLQQIVSGTISRLGYGVEAVRIIQSPTLLSMFGGGVIGASLSYQYAINIKIKSFAGDSAERVKNAIVTILGYWFSDVNLYLAGDTNQGWDQNGNLQVQSNNNPATQPIGLNPLNVLGNLDAGDAGKIFGLSFGTAAIIGIAAVYLLSRQSAPAVAYRRYYR